MNTRHSKYLTTTQSLIFWLTLGQAKATVHSKSPKSVGLSAINYQVIGPQAKPVVGEQGDQVMGEEQQQTDAGQKYTDGFQIGPKYRQLHLRRESI